MPTGTIKGKTPVSKSAIKKAAANPASRPGEQDGGRQG
jgi:hypothetical protein